MNLAEMKERHDNELQKIYLREIHEIEQRLSISYQKVIKNRCIYIFTSIEGNYDPYSLRHQENISKNDILNVIEKIKQHYKNDWEITHYPKTWLKYSYFTFKYKDKDKIETIKF